MKNVWLSKFRAFSIILAIIVFAVSVFSFNSIPANSANIAKDYIIYDAATGTKKSEYSLTVEHGEQPMPRAVIDTDERQIDWSKSGVVKICGYEENTNKRKSLGTGFVVGKHAIATAAHVVSDYKNSSFHPSRINSVKLFNADGTLNKTLFASNTDMEYHIPAEFYTDDWSYTCDYAVITVSEDLSKYQCFDLGYVQDSLIKSNSASISITGFPKEVRNEVVNTYSIHNMYTGVGTLLNPVEIDKNFTNDLIYYNVDTTGGNSGSPAYITETVRGQTFYTVIGMLNSGDLMPNPKYNFGVRFDSDVLKFYNGNINIQ